MDSSKTYPAPVRKEVLPLLGAAMFGLLMTAVMVARTPSLASGTDFHSAARTRTVVKKLMKAPVHKAPEPLLSVVRQDDIRLNQQVIADQTLRSLPSHCRENLQNFYVNYDPSAANRGLGGESTIIIIGTVPDSEFRALLIHECGHVTDLGGLRGTPNGGATKFFDGATPIVANDPSVAFYALSWISATVKQPGTKNTDFVSGYAAADPFEDFAETFAYYALQKEAFQALAAKNPILKAKYDFMDQVVFAGTAPIAKGQYIPGKKVPWDVTKLPYVWHAKK